MNTQTLQMINISISDLTELISNCIKAEFQNSVNLATQPQKPESEILTREQTKNLLGISFVTLWKHSRDGILTAKKIGSKVFYMRSDIDALLNQVA